MRGTKKKEGGRAKFRQSPGAIPRNFLSGKLKGTGNKQKAKKKKKLTRRNQTRNNAISIVMMYVCDTTHVHCMPSTPHR